MSKSAKPVRVMIVEDSHVVRQLLAHIVGRDGRFVVAAAVASAEGAVGGIARGGPDVISMGIRTLCFVAAILVGDGWLRWVLIVAAVILPYIAVVMANAVSSKSDGFALLDGASGYRELPPTSESEGPTGRPSI